MLTKNESPILKSVVPDSDRLYVFFGGISGTLGMPHFEFYRAAQVLDSNKLFLRDPSQCWYQHGLPAIGSTPFAVGEYLMSEIEKMGVSDIRFVGNSMGGFAALLFCSMLRRGKVIAFSPQTFIGDEKRKQHGDRRWSPQIGKIHSVTSGIHDLKPWISDNFSAISANIYVSSADFLDMIHARELAEFDNVAIHCFAEGGIIL